MIDGVKEVGLLLNAVKKGMTDCTEFKADWAKLAAIAAVMSNPSSFAYHVGKDLLVNGVDIYHEIKTAVNDYKNE